MLSGSRLIIHALLFFVHKVRISGTYLSVSRVRINSRGDARPVSMGNFTYGGLFLSLLVADYK